MVLQHLKPKKSGVMMGNTIIETKRLILRTWEPQDVEAYYEINQDPKVIEFLLGPLSLQQVNDFIIAMNLQYELRGFTCWAVVLKDTNECIGFIGLNYPQWESHFTPAVEVGWRLGSKFWGKGYATEGAKAALDFGFQKCGLDEIVSFTVPANVRSIRVMEKIGLRRDIDGDFSHPKLPVDHRLSQHILYRLSIEDYLKSS